MSGSDKTPANRAARGLIVPLILAGLLVSLQLFFFMQALQAGVYAQANWLLVVAGLTCFLTTAALGYWALRRH